MERIWMALSMSGRQCRILATEGPGDTLVKARLQSRPADPRAVFSLLEAVALWQGRKVHAVLVVDEHCSLFAPNNVAELFEDHDTLLYSLEWRLGAHRGGRREIFGLGDFRDLHRLLRTEVAR